MQERCKCPFFKCRSKSPTEIHCYLLEEKIPICKDCWLKIAEGDYAWGEDNSEKL